jgi:hypothetical protein
MSPFDPALSNGPQAFLNRGFPLIEQISLIVPVSAPPQPHPTRGFRRPPRDLSA